VEYKWKVAFSLVLLVAGIGTLLGMQALGAFNTLPGGNTNPQGDTGPITDITLTVNYGNGTTLTWTEITLTGTTTAERSVYAATAQKCEMTYIDYGGAYFITGIDGREQADPYYWQYYVNGQYAGIGALTNVLHSGDIVFWNYTTNQFV
jgi:hypothetical protein